MGKDVGRVPSAPGCEASPSAVPASQSRIPRAELEAAREAMVACFRAAISACYARQVRHGHTVEAMAARVGWSVEKMDRLLLVPRTIKLDQIAVICCALGGEPEMETRGDKIYIGVRLFPRDNGSRPEGRDDFGSGRSPAEWPNEDSASPEHSPISRGE